MDSPLTEQIKIIVQNLSNNNPAPKLCTIKAVYPNGYVDVELNIGDERVIMPNFQCIGSPNEEDIGIIAFIDGAIDRGVVITGSNQQLNKLEQRITELESSTLFQIGW